MSDKRLDELIEGVNAWIEEAEEEEAPGNGGELKGERDAAAEGEGSPVEGEKTGKAWEDRTLYGTPLRKTDMRNVVGYCRKHRGYITANQIRRKECLKKQCHYLERLENLFWEKREKKKAEKKRRKAERGY